MKRTLTVAAAGLLLTGASFGYYHFVHYASTNGPYTQIPEKFDLNLLPNNTLRFYIAQSGPSTIGSGDSFAAIVSQIKLAGAAWNNVPTSNLKLAFGGLIDVNTTQSAPGIDVVFNADVPPGLRAITYITRWDYPSVTSAGFIPILRSQVHLRNNLAQCPCDTLPEVTYDESFYTTVVHELGHAMGLQHSLTSGAMSQATTRGTTKSAPLTSDDIAGLSTLYPAASFASSFGSISGQVKASDGSPMNMASVVVISPTGGAISNLTNPDGTFQVDGIPPGIYYVYVHPLPPADSTNPYPYAILPPWGSLTAQANQITRYDVFGLQFAAQTYTITAGTLTSNVNFTVQKASSVPIYDVTTYSYPANTAVKASPVPTTTMAQLVATGTGITTTSGAPAKGLGISVMGGGAATAQQYQSGYLTVQFSPPYGNGPRHLIFSNNGVQQYVLPYAFTLTSQQPPNITNVTAATDSNGNPAALVQGTNLFADTRILFDGVVVPTLANNPDGSMLVGLPTATPGYAARVVALNSDGQSSLFVQAQSSVTQFVYPNNGATGSFMTNLSAAPAGAEAMIQIDASGMNFVDGLVSVGFGSSDIIVRKVFVVSPTRLYVNIGIQSQAAWSLATVTVNSGLQLLSLPLSFQILPVSPTTPIVSPNVVNAGTGLGGVSPGATVYLSVTNLGSNATVLLNGQPQATQVTPDGRLSFQIPSGFAVGPAVIAVQLGNGALSLPVAIKVDQTPPNIDSVLSDSCCQPLTAGNPAHPGQLITLVVDNLLDASGIPISVTVAGVAQSPASVMPGTNGTTQIQVVLPLTVPLGSQIPITVGVDTRVSAAFSIPVVSN